jgi:hypothetical protein
VIAMPAIDYKILISFSLGYGFILLAAFQLGFFVIVGFRYAGLIGAIDIWANIGVVAGYGAAIIALMLVLLIVFQVADQSGFDLVRWIADHSTQLAIGFALLSALIFVWLWFSKKQPFPFLLLITLPLLLEVTVTYCNLVSYQRVMVWSAVLSAVYGIILAYFVGSYSAFFNLVLETRRYDIALENMKIENVRFIRTSGSGVIYAQGNDISFANMAKIVSISPSPLAGGARRAD